MHRQSEEKSSDESQEFRIPAPPTDETEPIIGIFFLLHNIKHNAQKVLWCVFLHFFPLIFSCKLIHHAHVGRSRIK